MADIFNSDEKFLESVKKVGKDGKVEIERKAQCSQIKLGEVSGEKIELVRETMKLLVDTFMLWNLLSAITFNGSGNLVCSLKTVTRKA